MKRILLSLVVACGFAWAALPAAASEGSYAWDRFPSEKMTDMASLQHGAKIFVNYCLSCHSAAYMRYNRLQDIGLTDDEIRKNLLFATDKVGDTMKTSIDPKQAKDWFGATPPDLSVIARSRAETGKGAGADYLYTLWRTFYLDESKPTGWNNLAFPDIAMPHALWQLQGQRRAVFVDEKNPHEPEKTVHRFAGFEQVTVSSSTWTYAEPESRAWWGGLWADRIRFSRFGEQAVEYGLSDPDELTSIGQAFLDWAASPDAVFIVPHVEILAMR